MADEKPGRLFDFGRVERSKVRSNSDGHQTRCAPFMATRTLILCSVTLVAACLVVSVAAKEGEVTRSAYSGLHQLVARLGEEQARLLGSGNRDSGLKSMYEFLFPFESPAWNSILATFYISSVPNFILALVPAELELESLNTMVCSPLCLMIQDTCWPPIASSDSVIVTFRSPSPPAACSETCSSTCFPRSFCRRRSTTSPSQLLT
jgi:hypothetical protein